jgi:hypothetical protein
MGARKSWFIVQGDARRGPFSSSELKQFASEGKIERSTQVWKEGLKQPVPASRIKGLFSPAPDRASDVLPEQHVSGNSDLASSENLLPQLSRAKLRDLVSSQKREIAEIALSKSASQPGFLELKQRYITLAKEAEGLKSAIPAITTAGEQLKVAEQNVKAARKSVEAATKELLSQAEPLGEFGFECWDVLSDSAKIYLQPRQDLKSRIQNLMQKLADSNATSNVTIMEKAKVKATQLKLNAQLQVEKLKIKSANRQAGLALLEANDEVLVQSDQTQNILEIVSNRRRAIDELKQESAELAGPLEKATRAAGQAVGQPIKGLNDFTQIVKGHQKLIKTKDGELHSIRDDVADLLVSDSSLARTLGLADKVTQLTDTTQRLDDSPHAVSVATKAGRNWFGGLSDFGKIASVAGLLIGLCSVGWWLLPNGASEDKAVALTAVADPEAETETPQANANRNSDSASRLPDGRHATNANDASRGNQSGKKPETLIGNKAPGKRFRVKDIFELYRNSIRETEKTIFEIRSFEPCGKYNEEFLRQYIKEAASCIDALAVSKERKHGYQLKLAVQMKKLNHDEGASEIFDSVLKNISKVHDRVTLAKVCMAMVEAGMVEEARKVRRSGPLGTAADAITVGLVRENRLTQRKLLQLAEEGGYVVFLDAAQEYANQGLNQKSIEQLDLGFQFIQSETQSGNPRNNALIYLSEKATELSHLDLAKKYSAQTENPDRQLGKISLALLQVGRKQKFDEFFNEIQSKEEKQRISSRVIKLTIENLADHEDFGRAREMIKKLPTRRSQEMSETYVVLSEMLHQFSKNGFLKANEFIRNTNVYRNRKLGAELLLAVNLLNSIEQKDSTAYKNAIGHLADYYRDSQKERQPRTIFEHIYSSKVPVYFTWNLVALEVSNGNANEVTEWIASSLVDRNNFNEADLRLWVLSCIAESVIK